VSAAYFISAIRETFKVTTYPANFKAQRKISTVPSLTTAQIQVELGLSSSRVGRM